MADDQRSLFVSIAQMGWACGLAHPYEWLMNYLVHALGFVDDPVQREKDAVEAFVAFFRGCESGPGDPCRCLTPERLMENIGEWYYRKNPEHLLAEKPEGGEDEEDVQGK